MSSTVSVRSDRHSMSRAGLTFLLGLLASVPAIAQTDDEAQRGRLLYTTHCQACHTSAIHWRQKKLATDFSSLEAQVQRWQTTEGLNWSAEEIRLVSLYLNEYFYHFSGRDALGLLGKRGAK
ncbi:MAG TPA: cytochrome c [Gallionellaceae bacterium]|nr:cytochrome c [Gallionellaceae bacterium]